MRHGARLEFVKTVSGNRRDGCPGGRRALPAAGAGKQTDR